MRPCFDTDEVAGGASSWSDKAAGVVGSSLTERPGACSSSTWDTTDWLRDFVPLCAAEDMRLVLRVALVRLLGLLSSFADSSTPSSLSECMFARSRFGIVGLRTGLFGSVGGAVGDGGWIGGIASVDFHVLRRDLSPASTVCTSSPSIGCTGDWIEA